MRLWRIYILYNLGSTLAISVELFATIYDSGICVFVAAGAETESSSLSCEITYQKIASYKLAIFLKGLFLF